jgi:hypothetical protein
MAKDYIPKSTAARADWLDNFVTTVAGDKVKFNLSDLEVAELTSSNTALQTAIRELAEAEDNYNTKLAAKNRAESEGSGSFSLLNLCGYIPRKLASLYLRGEQVYS